jgi:undecaprenyl-diphosphatase
LRQKRIATPSTDLSSDRATAIAATMFLIKGTRRLGFVVAALWVTASRVYIGTHYFSDILSGVR